MFKRHREDSFGTYPSIGDGADEYLGRKGVYSGLSLRNRNIEYEVLSLDARFL